MLKKFLLFLFLLLCFLVTYVMASDRCQQYVQDVRKANAYYFGYDFPYWYALGQLRQESNCRGELTAFDGGMGIAQFMPATEVYIENKMKAPFNPYNPKEAIKANAFYMYSLHKQNWDGALWLTYCFYNSGAGTMTKEYKRVGITDYELMKSVCQRKILTLKSGQKLNLCDVGYDYPKKIYRYGNQYRIGTDKLKFW